MGFWGLVGFIGKVSDDLLGNQFKDSLTSAGLTDLTIVFDSDRTSGNVTMSLTATQTAALEAPARYVYDLDITDSSGTVTRIIEGLMTTRPNV